MWASLVLKEEYLKGKNEKGPYLGEFPFSNGQLRILVLEACYGLRNVATWRADGLIGYPNDGRDTYPGHPEYPYSDICFAFNILNNTQIVLGSADEVIKGILYPYTREFFNTFWDELGSNQNVSDSLDEALSKGSINLIEEHRVRGIGYMDYIYLRSNVQ